MVALGSTVSLSPDPASGAATLIVIRPATSLDRDATAAGHSGPRPSMGQGSTPDRVIMPSETRRVRKACMACTAVIPRTKLPVCAPLRPALTEPPVT